VMERARQMDGIRNPSINAGQIVQHVIAIQMLKKGLCRLSRVAVRSDFLFSEATIFGMGNKPTSSCAGWSCDPRISYRNHCKIRRNSKSLPSRTCTGIVRFSDVSYADIASAHWWSSFNLAPKPPWSRNLIRESLWARRNF
jgi:hypothetical protein